MYRVRIKKVPKAAMGLQMGDQSGYGLYVAGGDHPLPKAQDGLMVNRWWNPFTMKYEMIPPYYPPAAAAAPAASPAPVAPKTRKGLSVYQRDKLRLKPDFNRHGVEWLGQYGYAPTEEGYAQALRDVGFEGDTNDIKEVQKHLINLNLLNENTDLFQNLLKQYGMTSQGIGKGYDESWDSFGYDPEMNTAGWVKEMLENVYADNVLGKRTDKMLEELLKKPPKQKNASVVDYLNQQGIDSSKENRMKLARSFGMNDYNYSAADNLRLLAFLQAQEKKEMGGGVFGNFYQAGGPVGLSQTLHPVDRRIANIEAERGETVIGDFDDDGVQEHLKFGGRPHSQGGTPAIVPNGSFVFSNTRKLKIGGPVLAEFGKSADAKKKYTPAELAKQYNVNHYKELLKDADSDMLDKKTAQLMLQNYERKLGKLALLQEGMKGFPQGIPQIALPLVGSGKGSQEAGDISPAAHSEGEGSSSPDWEGLPVAQYGGTETPFRPPLQLPQMSPMAMLNSLIFPGIGITGTGASSAGKLPAQNDIPSWFKLWTKSNTAKGALSPTGRSTLYDPSTGNSLYDDYRYWSSVAGRPFKDAKDYQLFVYNQVQKADPGAVGKMWGDYGLTAAGLADAEDPNWGFGDGIFGARTALVSHWRPQQKVSTTTPSQGTSMSSAKTDQTKQQELDWKNNPPEKWKPWWMQDMVNLGAAYQNRYGLHKYMPSYVSPDAILPNAVYYDPTRSLAANQEGSALQSIMNTVYGRGPQLQRAVGSNIQGQAAGLAANILGDYNNRNVATANQLATIRAEIRNNLGLQKANALDTYLGRNTVANQQYDNAVRIANNDIRTNLLSGITNAQRTYWLNLLYPHKVKPVSGSIYYDPRYGKGIKDRAAGFSGGSDPLAMYKGYYDQFLDTIPGADRKYANDFAMRMAFANRSQFGLDSDGDAHMNTSGVGLNPMALALLQGYGPQYGGVGF